MKSLRWLCSCAFVLSFVPSFASADEPPLVAWLLRRVEEGLLRPLARSEGKRFSRERPPPRERRVRVTESTTTLDMRGREFVPFTVDVRFGDTWRANDIVGCAYPETGELFVKRGASYRSAAFLLGKNVKPVVGVCEAAPARS